MKVLAKFNLILLVIFGAGGILISQLSYSLLIGNARREVLADAQLMLASATSVCQYTATTFRRYSSRTPAIASASSPRPSPSTVPPSPSTTQATVLVVCAEGHRETCQRSVSKQGGYRFGGLPRALC